MDERKAFEAWQGSRKPSYPAEWEAWQTAWQAATLAERERAAKVCEEAWPEMHKYWGPGQARAACEDCAAAIRKG